VLLRFYEDKNSEEIGEQLNLPPGTVRRRLKEGLEILRERMDRRHGGKRAVWLSALAPGVMHPPATPGAAMAATTGSASLAGKLLVLGMAVGVVAVVVNQLGSNPESKSALSGVTNSDSESTRNAQPVFLYPASEQASHARGTVRDGDGNPISGAVVAIAPEITGTQGFQELYDRDVTRVTRTDEKGRYAFSDILAGNMVVTATANGFLPGYADPVLLEPGKQLSDVDVVLVPGGSELTGTVFDTGGGTIPGALVAAADQTPGRGLSGGLFFQTIADDKGHYRLTLAKGNFGLSAKADGYTPDHAMTGLATKGKFDFHLHAASRIVGRVVDGSGAAVENATITITRSADWAAAWSMRPATLLSDADGRFSSATLEPESFTVKAVKEGLVGEVENVLVAVGAAAQVEVAVVPGRVARGRVVDGMGHPIADALVSNVSSGFYADPHSANVNADGRFELGGLLPKVYRLTAQARGFATVLRIANMTGPTAPPVDFVLEPEARLLVEVVDHAGNPLQGATAEATSFGLDGSNPVSVRTATPTSANGQLVVEGLSAGRVSLNVSANNFTAFNASEHTLKRGEEKQIRIRIAKPATLSGAVGWAEGGPAAETTVSARGNNFFRGADVQSDGTFRFEKLPPGAYEVFATTKTGGFKRHPPPGSSAQIALSEGEVRTGVSLSLKRNNRRIEGVILDPEGNPIDGAQVGALDPHEATYQRCNGLAFIGKFVSRPDGSFSIEDLDDETYAVCARRPPYPDIVHNDVRGGTSGVKLRFERGGSISGVVVEDNGRPVTAFDLVMQERPAMFATLSVAPLRGQPLVSRSFRDGDGTFVLSGVEAGSFDIVVRRPEGRSGVATNVLVIAGQTTEDVRIVLQSPQWVTGRIVHDDDGSPVAGLDIEVVEGIQATSFTPSYRTRSDAGGRFKAQVSLRGAAVLFNLTPAQSLGLVPETWEVYVDGNMRSLDVGVLRMKRGDAAPNPRVGTGLRIRHENGTPVVTGIFDGSPAVPSGVRVRDRVLRVDGQDVTHLGGNAVLSLMAGETGTVRLTVQTGNGPERDVTLGRARF
jgi:Carboxypeptidase regulatory-like domain/Sigma-70, region 4